MIWNTEKDKAKNEAMISNRYERSISPWNRNGPSDMLWDSPCSLRLSSTSMYRPVKKGRVTTAQAWMVSSTGLGGFCVLICASPIPDPKQSQWYLPGCLGQASDETGARNSHSCCKTRRDGAGSRGFLFPGKSSRSIRVHSEMFLSSTTTCWHWNYNMSKSLNDEDYNLAFDSFLQKIANLELLQSNIQRNIAGDR